MYSTKEIRWFFEKEHKQLESWFSRYNLNFQNNIERTDIYLDVKNDDLNIKLREGNIELKRRQNGPRARTQLTNASGYCEKWTKWSFVTAAHDSEFSGILKDFPSDWVEVNKNRLAVKIKEENGKLSVVAFNTDIDYGCQIEYTLVKIDKKSWYTFGLEWFGDKYLEISPSFFNEILGESKLTLKQSMGYAAFLNTYSQATFR